MKTYYECTAYFKGIDGLGSCDDECQWWHNGACPCAKGSKEWDGKNTIQKTKKRWKRQMPIWNKIREHGKGIKGKIITIKLNLKG